MILKNIRDYLSTIEAKRFEVEKYSDKYRYFRTYRKDSHAEEMMEVGIRIWMELMQDGVFGGADETQSWLNIVWEKLNKKISRLTASDIYITLNNAFNRNIMSQNMLEKNINYSLDYHKILRKTDLALYWAYFCGFGTVKVDWDKWDTRQGWETGIPKVRVVDSRAIFLSPNIQQDYMDDIDCVFEQVTYDRDALFDKIRSGAWGISRKKAEELIEAINDNKEYNALLDRGAKNNKSQYKLVDVVICQYNKPEYVTVRKLKDYVGKDKMVYDVLEEDLRNAVGEENMQKVEDRDDDTALPEGWKAGKAEVVKYNAWYEVVLIPAINTVIIPPRCIGDSPNYIFLTGVKNPDSSYPISEAFRQSSAQNIFNQALTLYLISAFKQYKSIPAYVAEGITNLPEFLEHYEDQDVALEMDADWFKENGGNLPFKFIPPQGASPALTNVLEMMQIAIGESTASTPILSGTGDGSHQSGAAINSLTNNALDSSKSEFNPYKYLLEGVCERLKEYIAEYKNYVHKDEYFGMEVEVNGSLDTQMIVAAPNCFVVAKDETGNEEANMIKAERMERLYDKNIIDYETAIYAMELDNPDEIISIHRQQEPVFNFIKQLEERPDLINKAIQFVQSQMAQEQGQVQQGQPQQPQAPQAEGAA